MSTRLHDSPWLAADEHWQRLLDDAAMHRLSAGATRRRRLRLRLRLRAGRSWQRNAAADRGSIDVPLPPG
jgi:hypothetical protein